jgi:23S rRNA (pseudouridine1915-N3)-methyltransferase
MNIRFKLLMVGRTERGFVSDGLAHYAGRIKKRTGFQEVVIPEHRSTDPELVKRAEAKAILGALKPAEKVVLLDENGRSMTSQQLAATLGKWQDTGTRDVTFIIGGAFGVHEEVKQRAQLVLSLSAFTFPHQLVRLIFAEQLYRAVTILEGGPYHHS